MLLFVLFLVSCNNPFYTESSSGTETKSVTEYTVAYYSGLANSNTLYKTQSYSAGSVLNFPEDPTKTGYVFTGWYYDKGTWAKKAVNQSDTVNKNLKLYTYFVETNQTYTVDFLNDDAATVVSEFTGKSVGTDITLPSATPVSTKDSTKTFIGWYLASDGSGSPLSSSYTVAATDADASYIIKIYACYVSAVSDIPVTAISVSPAAPSSLTVGSSLTLSVTYTPSNATSGKAVTWASSDTSVATVSSTGVVTAIKTGNATITATTTNGKSASSAITVAQSYSISLDKASVSMLVSEDAVQLTASTTPAGTAVTWTSSDTSVATVSSAGKVTAVKKGTAVITAKISASTESATCTFTISETVVPSSLKVTASASNIDAGATATLSAVVTYSDSSTKTLISGVTYTSGNTAYGTVSGTTLTGVAAGTVKITGTYTENSTTVTSTCSVKVNEVYTGYRVHLYNDSWSTHKIYYYNSTTQTVSAWASMPSMIQGTDDYYYDLTESWVTAGTTMVIFYGGDNTNRYPADSVAGVVLPAGVTEAWFNFTTKEFETSNPHSALDSDTSLTDIYVNGTSIGSSATTYTVANTVTAVQVTAKATSSAATVAVSPSESTALDEGASKVFTITVTAEDGTTGTYMLTVTRKAVVANDVTLSAIKVNGTSIGTITSGTTSYTKALSGTAASVDATVTATATSSDAAVTVSPSAATTIADAGSNAFTITVTNGTASAAYTVTVTYTKTTVTTSAYYSTNKEGVGKNATITTWDDWTADMRIAQCAAYDDPRTWRGIQEVPYDVYAMYAAWDDTNLYVMVELTNIADRASFMQHDYAASDNAWWDNRDIPLGFIINTGKDGSSTSPTIAATSKPIWGAVNFSDSDGFNYLLYHSSKYGYASHKSAFVGVGTPGFFKYSETAGGFSYDSAYCMSVNTGTTTGTSGISIKYTRNCQVSDHVYYESTPTGNREESGQTGDELLASTTYTDAGTTSANQLDMSYQYTIPLATLGITKEYLESTGIGIRQLTTGGGSLMDCCPWDKAMVDVVTTPYSQDESTSAEKEDTDTITSSQARIGHAK